jgi:hypothetical protein
MRPVALVRSLRDASALVPLLATTPPGRVGYRGGAPGRIEGDGPQPARGGQEWPPLESVQKKSMLSVSPLASSTV